MTSRQQLAAAVNGAIGEAGITIDDLFGEATEWQPASRSAGFMAATLRPNPPRRTATQPYCSDPGVVNRSPVSSQVFRPDRIIGQPP